MQSKISLTSYNCRSLKNSLIDIRNLCNNNDIILLQEHWIPQQELSYINTISNNFIAFSSSPVDLSAGLLVGRPYGGLSILVKKNIANYFKVIDISDPNFICAEISLGDKNFMLFNCYMPHFDGGRNLEIYINIINKMQSIILEHDHGNVIMMGDFNCHLDTELFHELLQFCSTNSYILADVDFLGRTSNAFTYVSDFNGSCRWLDHILCSYAFSSAICNIQILDDCIISDLRPMQCVLNIDNIPYTSIIQGNYNSNECHHFINWRNLSVNDLNIYKNLTLSDSSIDIPRSVVTLDESNKVVVEIELDKYYEDIINCLLTAGKAISSKVKKNKSNHNVVPGWNQCR